MYDNYRNDASLSLSLTKLSKLVWRSCGTGLVSISEWSGVRWSVCGGPSHSFIHSFTFITISQILFEVKDNRIRFLLDTFSYRKSYPGLQCRSAVVLVSLQLKELSPCHVWVWVGVYVCYTGVDPSYLIVFSFAFILFILLQVEECLSLIFSFSSSSLPSPQICHLSISVCVPVGHTTVLEIGGGRSVGHSAISTVNHFRRTYARLCPPSPLPSVHLAVSECVQLSECLLSSLLMHALLFSSTPTFRHIY